MKYSIILAALLAASVMGFATPVSVTFSGVSGVSDGADYVLPYELIVDGKSVPATCYDLFTNVSVGQSWMANLWTLDEAVEFGKFSGVTAPLFRYEMAGILSTLPAPTDQDKIELQHAVWNMFSSSFSMTSPMQADIFVAASQLSTFNFNSVRFLEGVEGADVQAFIVDAAAPEPVSWVLIGAGLAGLGLLKRRKS
jgi:hypothetical protein